MLDEYRALVEQLKAELMRTKEAANGEDEEEKERRGKEENRRMVVSAPKSANELLAEHSQVEKLERSVRRAESQVRLLEAENADLETERIKLIEMLRRKKAAVQKVKQRNAQIQVDIVERKAVARMRGVS